MAATGRARSPEERREGGREGDGHEYKTLLGEKGDTSGQGGEARPLIFGEQLARKWAGVKSSRENLEQDDTR